jgi:hypothetical protein
VPTRFWEAVIVIIGLHVIRLVWIFASEQSYLGTVANGDLGLVPWVCRVSHSCHIHIRVEHDWQDLGSQVILVRLNILAFNHLSNLFLKSLLISCNLKIGVLTLIEVSGSEALALIKAHPTVHLRGVVVLILTLVIHGIIVSKHFFFYEVFESTVHNMVLLTWVGVVASLLNQGYEEILWHQTNHLTIHVENWETVMWGLYCFKDLFHSVDSFYRNHFFGHYLFCADVSVAFRNFFLQNWLLFSSASSVIETSCE